MSDIVPSDSVHYIFTFEQAPEGGPARVWGELPAPCCLGYDVVKSSLQNNNALVHWGSLTPEPRLSMAGEQGGGWPVHQVSTRPVQRRSLVDVSVPVGEAQTASGGGIAILIGECC
ncbi:hypothetical protein E2C01_000043 [Portunus trituberculatus]|uniref:Uncharacterized protein n=1 Tax=Portunus trituberculatus TaxID=210409 RepID=A0A5B7CFG7_PORTR|nr:hypothetical protein [Portunus trituberculatus]